MKWGNKEPQSTRHRAAVHPEMGCEFYEIGIKMPLDPDRSWG